MENTKIGSASFSVVSVVIHVYNEARCLERTLRQLKSLTKYGCNPELIVVDEGCTDQSMAIARKYADVIVPYDGGVLSFGKARNKGAEASSGKFIFFVDPDVLVPFDTYLMSIILLADNFDAVTCNLRVHPERELFMDRFMHELLNLRYRLLGSGCGDFLAVRREVFAASKGFREDLESVEDNEYVYRLSRMGFKVGCLPSNYYVYESPCRYRLYTYAFTYMYWTFNALKLLFGFRPAKYRRIHH